MKPSEFKEGDVVEHADGSIYVVDKFGYGHAMVEMVPFARAHNYEPNLKFRDAHVYFKVIGHAEL